MKSALCTGKVFIQMIYIVWLMMVPISEAEFKYVENNCVEELENLFSKEQIDIHIIYIENQ